MGVDVEKHAEHIFALWHHCFEIRAYEFDLCQSKLHSFWIVICKEVPIHIFALRIAPIISNDHSIWVDDRSDPKLKRLSHLVTHDLPRAQKVNESMQNETRMRLAAVLAPYDEDDGLRLSSRIFSPVCDLQQRNINVSVGVTQ